VKEDIDFKINVIFTTYIEDPIQVVQSFKGHNLQVTIRRVSFSLRWIDFDSLSNFLFRCYGGVWV